MSLKLGEHDQEHLDSLLLYALQALPLNEIPTVKARLSACPGCRAELESVRPIIGSFVSWPTDLLRPSTSLWERVEHRIAGDTGREPLMTPVESHARAEWEEAAPGISVKLLATDAGKNRVSMLVRLAPGTNYPPHRHAGVEELYLLHGELMIDDKKLYPGDYICAEGGSVDHRVWSETGCTCVLLTSGQDELL